MSWGVVLGWHRRLGVLPHKAGSRFAAPLVEPRIDAVTHQGFYSLAGRGERLFHRLKTVWFRHLDPGNKIRPHVAFAEDVDGIERAANPGVSVDAAGLAGVDPLVKVRVPNLHVSLMGVQSFLSQPAQFVFGLRVRLESDVAPGPAEF